VTSTPDGPTEGGRPLQGGDYPDRDVPEGDVEVPEGSYTDQETEAEKRGEEPDVRGPHDHGQYTDRDDTVAHRPPPVERGYTSTDTGHDQGNPTTGDEREEHPHG
jgi:hypothetical protein